MRLNVPLPLAPVRQADAGASTPGGPLREEPPQS
jgi:hypothetical protein